LCFIKIPSLRIFESLFFPSPSSFFPALTLPEILHGAFLSASRRLIVQFRLALRTRPSFHQHPWSTWSAFHLPGQSPPRCRNNTPDTPFPRLSRRQLSSKAASQKNNNICFRETTDVSLDIIVFRSSEPARDHRASLTVYASVSQLQITTHPDRVYQHQTVPDIATRHYHCRTRRTRLIPLAHHGFQSRVIYFFHEHSN
jgi:hypothetical protein